MYEALDPFLDRDTWHTLHPTDQWQFFASLDRIIRLPDFSLVRMGEYIAIRFGIVGDEHPCNSAKDQCVEWAGVIHRYLQGVGQIPQAVR